MIDVDHRQGQHQRAEERTDRSFNGQSEKGRTRHEEGGCRQLDQRVAPGDRRAATSAATSQQEEAQHRDVVPEPDLAVAERTTRVGHYDRPTERQSVDDHVHEAAENEAEGGRVDEQKRCRHGRILARWARRLPSRRSRLGRLAIIDQSVEHARTRSTVVLTPASKAGSEIFSSAP